MLLEREREEIVRACRKLSAAGLMVGTAGMLLKDMPPEVMLKADALVSVLAVDRVAMLRGPRADMRVMQAAHIIGMGVVIGEVVTGEAVTGIRPMDILGSAITV